MQIKNLSAAQVQPFGEILSAESELLSDTDSVSEDPALSSDIPDSVLLSEVTSELSSDVISELSSDDTSELSSELSSGISV